jgi:hypothetical protein
MSDQPDRRKPGRPRADEPRTSSVSAWVSAREHDRLIRLANQRDQSVSETVRRIIQQSLRD